jgi:DNA-binding response OmpR family regulator
MWGGAFSTELYEEKGVRNISSSQGMRNGREQQALKKLQILFVDGDQNACDKVQVALGSGFSVACASSVDEARAVLNTSVPDVLISEIHLGFQQENGLDLCGYVRSVSSLRHLPVMLLTSLTTLQDKIAGFHAGADDYVVKPFDAHHLQARIRLLARIKRLERHTSL